MLPGKTVAGEPIRVTSPSSWSVLISIGTRACWWRASRWIPFESPAIFARVFELVGPVEVDDPAGVELADQLGDVETP